MWQGVSLHFYISSMCHQDFVEAVWFHSSFTTTHRTSAVMRFAELGHVRIMLACFACLLRERVVGASWEDEGFGV